MKPVILLILGVWLVNFLFFCCGENCNLKQQIQNSSFSFVDEHSGKETDSCSKGTDFCSYFCCGGQLFTSVTNKHLSINEFPTLYNIDLEAVFHKRLDLAPIYHPPELA